MVDVDEHDGGLAYFLIPERRSRFRSLLTSQRGRDRLKRELAHFHKLDPRYAHRIPGNQHRPEQIERLLLSKGAPATCRAFSEDPGIDQRVMALGDALKRIVGYGMGTFLSCIPGKLAYFEGEEMGERYILERP